MYIYIYMYTQLKIFNHSNRCIIQWLKLLTHFACTRIFGIAISLILHVMCVYVQTPYNMLVYYIFYHIQYMFIKWLASIHLVDWRYQNASINILPTYLCAAFIITYKYFNKWMMDGCEMRKLHKNERKLIYVLLQKVPAMRNYVEWQYYCFINILFITIFI